MKNAHTKTKTAALADRCRQAFVRRVAVCCLFACAGLSAAQANPGDKERDAQRIADIQRAQQQQRQFEGRADENRRRLESQQAQQEQSAQNADAARRGSRMTPDERRDLRRQINEAGSDLYKNAPRR
jgi:septal ring factor EnvC (AmiA/AmiB activator)